MSTDQVMETATPVERGYLPVNGLQMHYEVHGASTAEEPPLVVLHGGFISTATNFGPMLPALTRRRRVIGFDQQGHGRTADIDRPLTFEQEADDTAAAIRHLGIEQADVFGFSDGGNVGLGLAIRHPGLVRKLVIAGTNASNEGLTPGILEFLATMTPEHLGDEMRGMYEAEAPRPADWPTLVAKISAQAVAFPGWTPAALASISAPTLVIIGDADIVTPEHAIEVVRLIPHAHLAVLPLRDHLELGMKPEWMLAMIEEFLDRPLPGPA